MLNTEPRNRNSHGNSSRKQGKSRTTLIGAILAVGALITAFPFFWMVTTALKPQQDSVHYPPVIIPTKVTLQFFVSLFTELDFGRYLLNTVMLVVIGFFGLLLVSMAGYGFSKFEFRWKNSLFFLVLATMMIPIQVTMIPTYLILQHMKLVNTIIGMAIPTLVSGFSIFLFRQFMATIPNEILEAGKLDGAGEWRIFIKIVMPMSIPILAVQAVLTFISGWNSFLWPLILSNDQSKYTLSVGLSLLNKQVSTNPSLQMAAASLMVVPILIVFAFLQKYIVQGFALSGLK
jgi:multiple sugar transport system permease protein